MSVAIPYASWPIQSLSANTMIEVARTGKLVVSVRETAFRLRCCNGRHVNRSTDITFVVNGIATTERTEF